MRTEIKEEDIEQSMQTSVRLWLGNGLYLIRGKKEGNHYWRLAYKFEDKNQTLSLGVFPAVSLDKAVQQASAHRALAKTGVNPSENRKQHKRDCMDLAKNPLHKFEILHPHSFHAVADKWVEYVGQDWEKNTQDSNKSRINCHLLPALGNMIISEITPKHITKIIKNIIFDGKRDTAQRVWEIGNRIGMYAKAEEYTNTNPFEAAQAVLLKASVKHYPAMTKLNPLRELLTKIYQYDQVYRGSFVVTCALKLITMLMIRPGNLRTAEWCQFDLEHGWWVIPGEDMKDSMHVRPTNEPHVVPLSAQAVNILKELYAVTGKDKFLFPNRKNTEKYISENAINRAFQIMGYSTKNDITGHGFRAIARTLCKQELGVDKNILELQLDHVVRGPNGDAYARETMLRERMKMMQLYADYLDGIRGGQIIYDDPLENFTPITSLPSIACPQIVCDK